MDEKNYEFQRISPTQIRAETAGGPRVSMPEKTNALVGQSMNLTCYIQSRAQFEVRFYKGEYVQIGGPLFFKSAHFKATLQYQIFTLEVPVLDGPTRQSGIFLKWLSRTVEHTDVWLLARKETIPHQRSWKPLVCNTTEHPCLCK